MTTKKSGLADSPFFRPSTPPPPPVEQETANVIKEPQSVDIFSNPDLPIRSSTQMHNRTNAHLNERTTAQMHNRAPEQMHNRTDEQPPRPTSRQSFDIFRDQADIIEELRVRWSRERRQHVTKGQVMRELLGEILPTKQGSGADAHLNE